MSVIGAYLNYSGGSVEYHREEVIKEVEVTPVWAQDQDAVKAAQAVIRKKELEAELSVLKDSWASTTAAYEAEKKAYQGEKERIEKELGTF
jgi:pectin methylesterase-like acyl-CoA thioesterase